MKPICKIFLWMSVGYVSGVMFARKPGKKLREEVAKSKTPIKTLYKELAEVDLEFLRYLTDKIDNYLNQK